ncbi:hypothetical protein FH972_025121 [Carpinus fangiana]|uniref:Uncharacterized protein n=1 Tax=Carpinus fangiana TaxID=176857 RepID=A0A5N6L0M9_9ROSI|nr:hypothetical protein FH972_025121 [Carpinus fangiana]
MEASEPAPNEILERRRLQNRVAQRKFRPPASQATWFATDSSHQELPQGLGYNSSNLNLGLNDFASWLPYSDNEAARQSLADLGPLPNYDISSTDSHLIASSSIVSSNDDPELHAAAREISRPSKQTSVHPSKGPEMHIDMPTKSPSILPYDASTTASSVSSDPAEQGWLGPLHIAVEEGHDRIIRILLEQNIPVNAKDSDGRTPLHLAVMRGRESAVAALLAHGARVAEVDSESRSPLHYATYHCHEGILRLLLEHSNWGADLDVDAYESSGWTPLHIAVARGFEAGMLLLLQCGSNLDFRARRCMCTGNVIPAQCSAVGSL